MELPSDDAVRRLLEHLPTFRRPAGELWQEAGNEERPDGSITLPYATYAPEVDAFLGDLGALGFIQPFDWPRWEPGQRMLSEPERIAEASLEDCVKLLTRIVRAARFLWGEPYDLDRGIFRRILERLQVLVSTTGERGPQPS